MTFFSGRKRKRESESEKLTWNHSTTTAVELRDLRRDGFGPLFPDRARQPLLLTCVPQLRLIDIL